MVSEDIITVGSAIHEFCAHLESHPRTILSARFGDGKSFFLNQFVQDKEVSEKYKILKIYPVNYQVEGNQDIFELIKRDLLIQLIINEMIPEEYEVTDDVAIPFFLQQHGIGITESLLTIATKIDTSPQELATMLAIIKGLKLFTSLKSKFEKFKKEGSDADLIDKFLKVTDSKGVYEVDPITRIIQDCVASYRVKTKKKVALMFEDMDRIDPAHLFRILNIISSQIDQCYRCGTAPVDDVIVGNKFSVDNVVVVLDYSNLRCIYHHFYGENTCFEGYISKFSNRGYFTYSLSEEKIKYYYCRMEEETELPISILKEFVKQDLMSSKTVRQVVSAIEDTKSQFLIEPMLDCKEGKKELHSGVLSLIVIMRRLGMNDLDIEKVLKTNMNIGNAQFLSYIAPLFLIKDGGDKEFAISLDQTSSFGVSPYRLSADGTMKTDGGLYMTNSSNNLKKGEFISWLLTMASR